MLGEYNWANIPAIKGAIAPPIIHRKENDADVVDVSTEDVFITAFANKELLFPKKKPEKTIHEDMTSILDVHIPIIKGRDVKIINIKYNNLTNPNFLSILGGYEVRGNS